MSTHVTNVLRSALAPLLAAALLAGCPDSSTTGGDDPQPLDTCLVNYWRSPVGDCSIMPECTGSPTGDLATACSAADCASLVFTGYRGDGSRVWGIGTWSSSSRVFCSTDMLEGTWSVADATHITIEFGGNPPVNVPAVCLGATATVNDTTVTALPSAVATALEARATAGDWTPCGY